jgi:DNA-binding PadR family transcriptional regulator
MIELMILSTLLEGKKTVYAVKQDVEKMFFPLIKISFGTIHPALKRMLDKKYISVKSETSKGGQKKTAYSINEVGKDRFREIMLSKLPDNPIKSSYMASIKTVLLSFLKDSDRHEAITDIKRFYEYSEAKIKNFLEKAENKNDEIRLKYLKTIAKEYQGKIDLLNSIK